MAKAGRTLFNSLSASVDIVVENILKNPHCEHGPTVLFKRRLSNGNIKQYYACSACRDRKFCSFYAEVEQEPYSHMEDLSHKKKEMLNLHCQRYNKFQSIRKNAVWFCTSCSIFVSKAELVDHSTCTGLHHLPKKLNPLPSQILCPKSNPKCEAQYFFTDKSVQILIETLQRLNVEKLLCIGAPRLHEVIKMRDLNLSSVLLDIDDRFCNFFPIEEFFLYNLFTHYFFCGSASKETYRTFLKGSQKIVLLMDPPFGGRMELISNTIHIIEKEWRQMNDYSSDEVLPVIFIFPYFCEKTVKSHLPSLTMLEYQVDYDNHPLYTTGPKGMKRGSAVRMFTNLAPSLFPFPEDEGYSFCNACDRWVHPRNVHCLKCGDCTSKDGRTYKHCDVCGICVKPMWSHCQTCSRCLPKEHRCKTYLETKGGATQSTARPVRQVFPPTQNLKRNLKAKTKSKAKKLKSPLPQNRREEKERDLMILQEILKKQ